MSVTRTDGLPFLPGNTFKDPTRTRFHLSNTLSYKNGISNPRRPTSGLGGERLVHNQLSEEEVGKITNQLPTLTYGQAQQAPPESFVPSHVAFDKKVLRFSAFFKETVHESSDEFYRVRLVDIYYYLEDDSISVIEPIVNNSGIPQGKLIKRQRLPKDDQGNHWHWTDFNLGKDVIFYGKSFHIINCDQFTTEFLESQGLDLNSPESAPLDPYIKKRTIPPRVFVSKSDFDQLKRFLTLDRKVLRFYCVWDDRESLYGELVPFVLHFFLVDNTVEVLEAHRPNDGRDPFPVLLRRQRLSKNRGNLNNSFPMISLELSDHEMRDWFTEHDFGIGRTVVMYNRRFLIYDCDEFTKNYLRQTRGETNFTPIQVEGFAKELPKMDLPEYNGFGSLEDSRQNCLHLRPRPPKKDVIKMLENLNKILRYEAKLVTMHQEDVGRRFIISYRLADDMISIFETPKRNSGIIPGKYLEARRIPKPGSDPEYPDYYSPADLAIGSTMQVLKHRFIITGCDEYVLKMLLKMRDRIPVDTIESVRKYIEKK